MILNENIDRKIIPIAGGKGGVGKSVIAINMALSFAMNGKKTVLVDLDLGGSNIHTLMGEKNVKLGIGHIISGLNYSLTELLCATKWENFFYIPGDVLVYGSGEPTRAIKARIIDDLLKIDADYIILDLGGGTNFTILDFFLVSNSGLIVTTPQTTSILNAYSYLKSYVFRFLQRAFKGDKETTTYLKKFFQERYLEDRKTMSEIIQEISSRDTIIGEKTKAYLEVLQPKLILNKVTKPTDIYIAEGLRDICKKNLSVNIECLGAVLLSKEVDQSVDMLSPFIVEFPDQVVTDGIHRISQKILQSRNFPDMPLELDYYSDTFELANIETEIDIATRLKREESTKDTPTFDVDQLLELVRLQQNKIQELQGTVRILSIGQ